MVRPITWADDKTTDYKLIRSTFDKYTMYLSKEYSLSTQLCTGTYFMCNVFNKLTLSATPTKHTVSIHKELYVLPQGWDYSSVAITNTRLTVKEWVQLQTLLINEVRNLSKLDELSQEYARRYTHGV